MAGEAEPSHTPGLREALMTQIGLRLRSTVLIAGCVSLALAEEPPSGSDLKKRAVALGRGGSIVGFDVPRDGDNRPDVDGWAALGRVDLHDADRGWGVQLGYAVKDGGTGSAGEISLAQADLHLYYAWE